MTDQDDYQPNFSEAAKRGIRDFSEDDEYTPDPQKVRNSGKVFDFTEGYDPDKDEQDKARRNALPKVNDWDEAEETPKPLPKKTYGPTSQNTPDDSFPIPYSEGAEPWATNEGPQQGFHESTGLREVDQPPGEEGPTAEVEPEQKPQSTGLREKDESTGLREKEEPTGVREKTESTGLREGTEQTGLREDVDGVMPEPEDSEDRDTSQYGAMRNPDLAYRYMEKVGSAIAQAAAEMGGSMVSRGWDLASDIVRMTFTQPHAMSSTSRMIGTAMGSLELAGDFADRAAQKYGVNLQQDPELIKDTIKYKLYQREAKQANGVVGNTFRAISDSLGKMGVQDISQMTPDQLSQHVADMRQEASRLMGIIAKDKENLQLGKRQNRLSSQDRGLVYAQAKHLQSYLDQLSKQGATMAADQRMMARQQRQASRRQRMQAQSTLANGSANPYQQILQWADPNANWEIDGNTGMPTQTGAYNIMLRTLRDRREQERRANNGVLDPAREQWYNQMDQKLTQRRDDVQRETRQAPIRQYGNVFVGMSDHAPGIGPHINRILRFGIWPSTVPVKSIRDYLANIVQKGATQGASAAEINHARALLMSLDMHTRTRSMMSKMGRISARSAASAMRHHLKAKDKYAGIRLDATEAQKDEALLSQAYKEFNAKLPKDFATAQNFDPNDPAFQQALHKYERALIDYENKWFPLRAGNRQSQSAQPGQAGSGQTPPGPGPQNQNPAPQQQGASQQGVPQQQNQNPQVVPQQNPQVVPQNQNQTPQSQNNGAGAGTPGGGRRAGGGGKGGKGRTVNPTTQANQRARDGLKRVFSLRQYNDSGGRRQQPISKDERIKQIGAMIGDDLFKGVNQWGRFTDEADYDAAYNALESYLEKTYPELKPEPYLKNFTDAFYPSEKKDLNDEARSMNAEWFKGYFKMNGIDLDENGRFKSIEDYKRARGLLIGKFGESKKGKIREGLKQFIPVVTSAPSTTEKIDAADPASDADADDEPEFFDDGSRNWVVMPMISGDDAKDMESAKKIYDALGDDPKAFLEDVLQKVNTKSDKVKFADVGQMLDAFSRVSSMDPDDPLSDTDVYMETKNRPKDDPVYQATLAASRVANMRPQLEKMGVWDNIVGTPAQPQTTDTSQTDAGGTQVPKTPVTETEQNQKKEGTDEFVEDEEMEKPVNISADAEYEGGQETEDFSKTNPIAAGLLQHESLKGAGVDTPEKLDDLVLKLINHVNANTTRTDVKIGISTKKLGSSKGWKQYREDKEAGKDVQRPTDTKRLIAFMEAMKDLGIIDKDKQRFDDEDVELAETLFSRVAEGKLSGRMEQIAPEYIAKVQDKYNNVLKDAAKISRFGKNLWKVDVDKINTNSEDDDFFTKFYASLIQEHPLGEDGKPDQVLTDFEEFMKMSEDDVRRKYKSSAGEAIWKAKAIEEFVNTPMEGGGLDGRWPGMKQEELDTQVVREPMPQLQMEDGSPNPVIWSQLGRFMNSYRGASKEEKNAALGNVKEYHKALQKEYERTGRELSNPDSVNNAVKEYTADLEAKAEEKCKQLKASRDNSAEARFQRKMAENQEKYKSGEWSERTFRGQTTRITNLRDAELEESKRKYQTDMDRERANFEPQIRQRTRELVDERNSKIDKVNDIADSWSAFTRDMNLRALSADYALNRIPLPPELQKKENVKIYETMEPQKYVEDFENLVNPYAKVDSVKEYLDKIAASIKERYAEEGEIKNKQSIEMYKQKLETIAKKAQDQIDKEERELANAPDESEDIHEAYRNKTTPLLEKLKEANDKGVAADEWLVNRLDQLTDEIANNPDLSEDFKQEWARVYAEEGARRDQIVSELQAADEARRQTEEANKEAARKLRVEQLKTYITQAINNGSVNPAFLESTIRYSDDLSDEDKKALWDMLHPDSGEVIDEADVGGETPIHKAPENKYVEEEGEEDSDRFNGAASLEDWRDDLEYEFRGTDSLPDKDVLKKFENEIARIEDPEKKQEYESWLDRMKEHTHLFGKIDKIFFMEDPDMVDNLVDLIQNRDWGQLYQDIRGHNLNDEVDRKTEFAEALEDSGVGGKEIQYIMGVVGPILDGLEIKKSFREIMRERNPDWE